MLVAKAVLLASSLFCGQLSAAEGVVSGTVVNASEGKNLPCPAEVVLRVQLEGQFVPFRQTVSDAQGKFCFDRLPVGDAYRYLPGASHDGVHFPGPRVQLTAAQPRATVALKVYDAVAQPSPLVLRSTRLRFAGAGRPANQRVDGRGESVDRVLRGQRRCGRRSAGDLAVGDPRGFQSRHLRRGVLRAALHGDGRKPCHEHPLAAG